MEEVGPQFETQVLQSKKRTAACDAICLVYDSGDANSFAYVANLRVFIIGVEFLLKLKSWY